MGKFQHFVRSLGRAWRTFEYWDRRMGSFQPVGYVRRRLKGKKDIDGRQQ